MAKKYYKVLNKDLMSAACCNLPSNFRTQYYENQWVESPVKGTRLFVFPSLYDAENFIYNDMTYKYALYECEVKNPRKDVVAELNWIQDFWNAIFSARKKKSKIKNKYLKARIPVNTYSATHVKITKLIRKEDR